MKKYQRDYILSNIKLNNFYLLWNCKVKNKPIKDIFNYKDLKNIDYSEYETVLYIELSNMLLDTLYQQLNTLNKFLFDKNFETEKYLKIPSDIRSIIEKGLNDYKLIDIIKLNNFKTDNILYDLQSYCDNLKDILEMFFETEKWFQERKNYLLRNEGKEEYNLYLKYIKQV